ncbi:MAG: hypothetical protein RLZZ597_1234 [Cyanobacteriota bacterium]
MHGPRRHPVEVGTLWPPRAKPDSTRALACGRMGAGAATSFWPTSKASKSLGPSSPMNHRPSIPSDSTLCGFVSGNCSCFPGSDGWSTKGVHCSNPSLCSRLILNLVLLQDVSGSQGEMPLSHTSNHCYRPASRWALMLTAARHIDHRVLYDSSYHSPHHSP